MHKIAVIFGTRPEAIKLAPVIRAFERHPAVDCRVCVTGQHRELLDQALAALEIVPDADLDLMQPNQSLAAFAARAVTGIDVYLAREQPQLVLAQGDTTSTLAAALASFYRRIPFGHVEAGLRTGDLEAPFPEEANRVLAARLARLHFAPTSESRQNLLAEGIRDDEIVVTGNTGIDALHLVLEGLKHRPVAIAGLPPELLASDERLVLVTSHRRENLGEGIDRIGRAVARLARDFPTVRFVIPLHLNPQARTGIERQLGRQRLANVHLIEPLDYRAFVALLARSSLILTDSGGVQEEAPSLGKPVLVLRDTTERSEAVDAGAAQLVGTDVDAIVRETSRLLADAAVYRRMARVRHVFGDGRASERIVGRALEFLGVAERVPLDSAAA